MGFLYEYPGRVAGKEQDRLLGRLYEDGVSGKISNERFTKLSSGYEAEQKELREKVAILQTELMCWCD